MVIAGVVIPKPPVLFVPGIPSANDCRRLTFSRAAICALSAVFSGSGGGIGAGMDGSFGPAANNPVFVVAMIVIVTGSHIFNHLTFI